MRRLFSPLSFMITGLVLACSLSSCDDNGSEPDPAGIAAVSISTDEVTETSVTVTFTPNDNTVSYSVAVGSADELSKFEDGLLTGIENVTTSGANQKVFRGLNADTQYTIFARGVNSDGVVGQTATETFKTEQNKGPASVVISLDEVSNRTVTATFTPNNSTVSYSVAIGAPDKLAEFENGTLPDIQVITEKGEKLVVFTGLEPTTDYMVFARGVNSVGVKGETSTETLTTLLKQELALTAVGAFGEYYGGWWADNTDLWLHSETNSSGEIINGFAIFFESFAPEADDPQNPIIVPGTYVCTDDTMPDEYEFAMGLDDGSGNIRSSQYQEFVDGNRTQYAIIDGNYVATRHENGTYTISVDVETEEHFIKCTYSGEIEVEVIELYMSAFSGVTKGILKSVNP